MGLGTAWNFALGLPKHDLGWPSLRPLCRDNIILIGHVESLWRWILLLLSWIWIFEIYINVFTKLKILEWLKSFKQRSFHSLIKVKGCLNRFNLNFDVGFCFWAQLKRWWLLQTFHKISFQPCFLPPSIGRVNIKLLKFQENSSPKTTKNKIQNTIT